MLHRLGALSLAFTWILVACDAPHDPPAERSAGASPDRAEKALFVDRSLELGLDHRHDNGMTGALYMVEALGPGAALADFDGDGDLDVYLVQGGPLGPPAGPDASSATASEPDGPRDRMLRNQLVETGSLGFSDVTEASGIDARGYGMGAAVGDLDGDGRPDLYLSNFGPDQLWRNLGDGRFDNTTARAGNEISGWSSAVTPADVDFDGDLDLLVVSYLQWSFATHKTCRQPTSAPDYCGPQSFPPAADRLLINRGDGRFDDVTSSVGLAAAYGAGLGSVAFDVDEDGRTELLVANDAMENQLWIRTDDGRFVDEAAARGVAFNGAAEMEASMGVAVGDVDGDGDQDLLLSHLTDETNTLYLNDGTGYFVDRTRTSGLASSSVAFTSFGTGFLDVDNDGRLDLFLANGAVRIIAEQQAAGLPHPLAQRNQLFRNLGGGRFAEWTAAAGAAFEIEEVSRGAAFGDVDNDGDTDVLLTNNGGPVRLLLNQLGQDRPWLGLRLVDGGRTALGATATVERAGRPPLVRTVRVDGSYLSSSDPRLLFGLGDQPEIERLLVRWPDRSLEAFAPPAIGRYHVLRKGEGTPVPL